MHIHWQSIESAEFGQMTSQFDHYTFATLAFFGECSAEKQRTEILDGHLLVFLASAHLHLLIKLSKFRYVLIQLFIYFFSFIYLHDY